MRKLSREDVLAQCAKIHNNKYDYSKSIYQGTKIKMEIICPDHGSFWQIPKDHKSGHGCYQCSGERGARNKRLTLSEFITRSEKIHGDQFDYSNVNYVNMHTKVNIRCTIHGSFWQTPSNHLNGKGCGLCGRNVGYKNTRTTLAQFIERSNKKHDHHYDYSQVVFETLNDTVIIGCPEHGLFTQNAKSHMHSSGCPKCGLIKNTKSTATSMESFIERSNELHNNKYDYSLVSFKKQRDKIIVSCPDHGLFNPTAETHLRGQQCPKCANKNVSIPEDAVSDYLESLEVTAQRRVKGLIGRQELDIYIPEHKLAVEFNGLYWHSDAYLPRLYHRDKTRACNAQGIRLIHIWEDEWYDSPHKIKALLRNALGKTPIRIGARQTTIRAISSKTYRQFCDRYHLKGDKASSTRFGAFYGKTLVSVCGFSTRKGVVHMDRFVSHQDFTIAGMLSKFKKHFGQPFITYCDLDHFDGQGYLQAGFELLSTTAPSYWYTKAGMRFSREQFQKHKLEGLFDNFDTTLSGDENCRNNGYYKVYGVGNLKFMA